MRTILTFLTILCMTATGAQTTNESLARGNQYYRNTQYALAEKEYRDALQEDPSSFTASYNLANALHKQKKFDEANKILEQLAATTEDKKKRAAASYNGGVGHTKQKNLEESIESYKKALRADPGDQQARENLQKALRELKKQQSSSQDQQKSQSNMSQKEAEQKLRQLQEKERQLQQRMQSRKGQGGGKQSKDW